MFQIQLDMSEKLTIQERVKLVFVFGKNGATYRTGAQLLGHPLYISVIVTSPLTAHRKLTVTDINSHEPYSRIVEIEFEGCRGVIVI